DCYTNKNTLVKGINEDVFVKLKHGDKVVYNLIEQTGGNKLSIGTNLGHEIQTDRYGEFERILEGDEKEFFDKQQKIALKIFPLFKKLFKKNFANSIPVTAKFHIFTDQIYFYFYSEDRYVFTDFVKEFRQELGKNIFLFQIGARDMIKMSPGTDCIVGCNGINLCCKSSRALPSVEIENIVLQNLEGRDIEKLKGRCGKLKCSLIYELELYLEDSKKFPQKGTPVKVKNSDICGVTSSFNIMSGDVTVRTDDGVTFRIPLDQIKTLKEKEEK
ncbi:MAG: regulatory iron-sulfur-containing complex subunit RicT, partial [Candidatus Absconditabacterales bacterium]